MRHMFAVLTIVTLVTGSHVRPAAADLIVLCNDPFSSWCVGYGPAPGFAELYVQHSFSIGATGSTFTVDVTRAPGTTLLGFESLYAHEGQLGGAQTVIYNQECKVGSFVIGTVYMIAGCGEFRVAPATAIDCSGSERVAYDALVGALCNCGYMTSRCFPVATEQTTWGRVKSLYR